MSTRWYPLFQAGNPQLRVFLPNFWMKLVKPQIRLPSYMVQFHVSPEMTDYDIKNYLTKIYNLPVIHVRTEILMGTLGITETGGIGKKDDVRLAHITLRRDTTFTFPDVVAEKQRDAAAKQMTTDVDNVRIRKTANGGKPKWFT